MSLSKTNLLPKSAGNNNIPRKRWHDCKIVYRDVKNQMTKQINKTHSTSLARCTYGCKPFGYSFCITGFWMALGIVNSMKLSIQVLHVHIKNDLLTLMQSYKRTPNIFYASSPKSKNQSCILSIFINKPSLCRGSKRYFISKRLIRLARTKSQ